MLPRAAITGALILSVCCNKAESGDTAGIVPSTSGSAAKPGSGFSAALAKELGAGGDSPKAGSDRAGSGAKPDPAPKAGSDAVAKTGSDEPKAGSNAATPGSGADPAPKAGSNAVAMTGSGAKAEPAPKADGPKAGSNAVTMAGSGAKADPAPKADGPKAGSNAVAMAGSGAKAEPAPKADTPVSATGPAPEPHGPVKLSAELAAIKLSLLPNWDRDVDAAGTFQYVVRIKGSQATKTFSFHYGYEDSRAPADRDQYKKYLQDAKVLLGDIKDRQRGAAWFLEGTDASGLPAFRYLVLYGGKRLICYGSLYKDGDSSRLGDDRDQTVIQAKQICETLAL
jgi:hypothetical protein